MVLAERTIVEDIDTGKVNRQCRFLKLKYEAILKRAQRMKLLKTQLHNNKLLLDISEKSSKNTTKEILKWVHIAISNAKRNFAGIYHKIKRKYLQLYLNEFVYKLNRKYLGERIFNRLVIANITGL